jgi:DNA repair ATPase RecN
MFIGDTVAVLEHEYLDRNQPLDATPVVSKLNKTLRAVRDADKYAELQVSLAQSQNAIIEKDKQMNTILEQLQFSHESLSKTEARNEAQTVEIEVLRRQITSLQEKGD